MYEAVETLKLRSRPTLTKADSMRKNVDCVATEATSRTYSTTSLNKTLRDRVKRMQQTSRSAHAYHDTPQSCRRPPRAQHESAASGCLFFSGSSKSTSETKGYTNIAQINNKKGQLKDLVSKVSRNKQIEFERTRSDKQGQRQLNRLSKLSPDMRNQINSISKQQL